MIVSLSIPTINLFEVLEKVKKTFPEVYYVLTATLIKKFLDGDKGKKQSFRGFKREIMKNPLKPQNDGWRPRRKKTP